MLYYVYVLKVPYSSVTLIWVPEGGNCVHVLASSHWSLSICHQMEVQAEEQAAESQKEKKLRERNEQYSRQLEEELEGLKVSAQTHIRTQTRIQQGLCAFLKVETDSVFFFFIWDTKIVIGSFLILLHTILPLICDNKFHQVVFSPHRHHPVEAGRFPCCSGFGGPDPGGGTLAWRNGEENTLVRGGAGTQRGTAWH